MKRTHFTSHRLLRFDSLYSTSSYAPYESKYSSRENNFKTDTYGEPNYKSSHFIDENASSLSDNDDEEMGQYDEEFEVILKRIMIKNGQILMRKHDASTNTNEYLPVASRPINTNQVDTNKRDNNLNPTSITVTTLKYLFKLLKFYKLEHYMSDLIENGYHTPISLHKLRQNELDTFNVSPYDKKKFLKLQLFIKQLMTTINKSKSSISGNNKLVNNGGTSSQREKFSVEEKRFLESEEFKNFSNEPRTETKSNNQDWVIY